MLAGVPSIFIRLAGCPIGCKWCDTKYALDPSSGDDLSIGQIINRVSLTSDESRVTSHECRHIVITGGEPMVNAELPELAASLKKQGKHITIETAGIKFVPGIACDLMSISPKTSKNSGQETKNKAVKQLISHYPYQLKFVVDSPDDLPEIRRVVKSLVKVDPTRIMLMPQARTRKTLLAKSPMVAELCAKTGYAFCGRLQILLYDGARGK